MPMAWYMARVRRPPRKLDGRVTTGVPTLKACRVVTYPEMGNASKTTSIASNNPTMRSRSPCGCSLLSPGLLLLLPPLLLLLLSRGGEKNTKCVSNSNRIFSLFPIFLVPPSSSLVSSSSKLDHAKFSFIALSAKRLSNALVHHTFRSPIIIK